MTSQVTNSKSLVSLGVSDSTGSSKSREPLSPILLVCVVVCALAECGL